LGVLRPVANAYLDSGYGGAIVFDGIGQLTAEFKNRSNYVCIEPGSSSLALLEGLEPSDIVQALSPPQSSSDGDVVSSARKMLLSTAVIEFELERAVPEKYLFTFQFLYVLLDRLSDKEQAPKYTNYLKKRALDNHRLAEALQYFDVTLPQVDDKTRSSVLAVCKSWLSPIMHHPKITEWTKLSKGADVTTCLRGGVVGINLPASEYGDAGKLITALVKARIFRAVRQRPSNWKDNGADTPILMIVDEAQAVVDEFIVKLGKDQALALLNNFRSFVLFATSEATYEWAMSRIGTGTAIASQPMVNAISANFATPFQAVAQVMRGGVIRRDVIKVTPSFNDGGIQSGEV
jgi:hypothetical protein